MLALKPSFREPTILKSAILFGRMRYYTDAPSSMWEGHFDENNKIMRWNPIMTLEEMENWIKVEKMIAKEEAKIWYGIN